PETDGVAQTVELPAKIGGRARDPGHVAVENVEEHGRQDEPAAVKEIPKVFLADGIGRRDLAREGNGREAADGVAQGQQRWQDGDLLHGAPSKGRKRECGSDAWESAYQ